MTPPKTLDINTNFIIYSENRHNFYKVLIERLPLGSQKTRFKSAIFEYANPQEVAHSLHNNFNEFINLGAIETLVLADMLKKRGYGEAIALNITSIEEALTRAQSVESLGYEFLQVVLKQCLKNNDLVESHASENLATLQNLKRLEDDLRYGRLNF